MLNAMGRTKCCPTKRLSSQYFCRNLVTIKSSALISSNSQKKMSNDHTAATNAKPSAKSFNDLTSRSTQSLRSPVSGTRLGPAPRFPTPVNVSHQPLFLLFSKVLSPLAFANLFREEVCIATNSSPTTQTCCHLGRAKPFRQIQNITFNIYLSIKKISVYL